MLTNNKSEYMGYVVFNVSKSIPNFTLLTLFWFDVAYISMVCKLFTAVILYTPKAWQYNLIISDCLLMVLWNS